MGTGSMYILYQRKLQNIPIAYLTKNGCIHATWTVMNILINMFDENTGGLGHTHYISAHCIHSVYKQHEKNFLFLHKFTLVLLFPKAAKKYTNGDLSNRGIFRMHSGRIILIALLIPDFDIWYIFKNLHSIFQLGMWNGFLKILPFPLEPTDPFTTLSISLSLPLSLNSF